MQSSYTARVVKHKVRVHLGGWVGGWVGGLTRSDVGPDLLMCVYARGCVRVRPGDAQISVPPPARVRMDEQIPVHNPSSSRCSLYGLGTLCSQCAFFHCAHILPTRQ